MTQKPDEATAKDSGGGFDPHPEGQYSVVCVDVVNLGIRVEEYPGSEPREVPKAAIVFASGERQDNGTLTIITAEMTLSMHEKANMRQFLESWRGRSYKPEQATDGIPLHKLHGQVGLVSIEHILTARGRRFAKVRSIAPLPKGMEPPPEMVMQEYERPDFFEERKVEYAEQLARFHARHAPAQTNPDESYDDDEYDDDLLF